MGLFGWFRRKHPARLQPEAQWIVEIEDDRLSVTDDRQNRRDMALSDLAGVAIATNDSGPWGTDVWWLLNDTTTNTPLLVPQGATGEQALIDMTMKLPGADLEGFVRAMGSTDNAVFLIWKAPNGSPAD